MCFPLQKHHARKVLRQLLSDPDVERLRTAGSWQSQPSPSSPPGLIKAAAFPLPTTDGLQQRGTNSEADQVAAN
jgi:hypothetical protein